MLASPADVAVDSAGNVYIADGWNRRIRKVDAATRTIITIAGTGDRGYGGDGGPATQARLSPSGVTVDGAGNIYIADGGNNRIRKVDAATGTISTIAGTGEWGDSGDGGPATEARLAFPNDVAVGTTGDVYVSDNSNNRIRKIDVATGTISTIAGTGEQGHSGDGGPATEAGLYSPGGVAVDGSGNVYIADSVNNRIRKIDAAMATISTIAGTGEGGYSGDGGLATGARLKLPRWRSGWLRLAGLHCGFGEPPNPRVEAQLGTGVRRTHIGRQQQEGERGRSDNVSSMPLLASLFRCWPRPEIFQHRRFGSHAILFK